MKAKVVLEITVTEECFKNLHDDFSGKFTEDVFKQYVKDEIGMLGASFDEIELEELVITEE